MDGDDSDHDGPPSVSRIARNGTRRYRTLSRFRASPRQKRVRPIAELIGRQIAHHGLTDECRQHVVVLFWDEIIGARLAPRTWPARFADGLLHVETDNSSWVHELQFQKAMVITKINAWVDVNRIWLGPPPLVTDVRFELGGRRKQTTFVEREYVRRIKARHLNRLWRPRLNVPPVASNAEREAITREARTIIDPDLRAIVESVRVK